MPEAFELNPGIPATLETGGSTNGLVSLMHHRQEEEEGLLLIKLTPHRIIVTVISIAFILAKGIAAYRRLASISITLDIVFGLLSLELWWIGFYDQVDRAVWRWWFHTDHSRRVLDFTASALSFGMMYGAVTLSQYLSVLIFQHPKLVGVRAVVVAVTICTAVILTTGILTLCLLRLCAKRRLQHDPHVAIRFNLLWTCSAISAVGLWVIIC